MQLFKDQQVPTGTEKPGKMEGIFQLGKKVWEFGTDWKSQENHTKYWKNLEISDKSYLLFLVIFK